MKVSLGTICLLLASPFVLTAWDAWDFRHIRIMALAIIAFCWIAGTGVVLIAWRNRPLSENRKIGLTLNLCLWVGCFIAVPHFTKERLNPAASACINNLRQIDAAANEFALEQNRTTGSPINFPSDLTPYIKLNSAGKIPPCPDGGVYSLKRVGDTPTCSLGTTMTPAHVLPMAGGIH